MSFRCRRFLAHRRPWTITTWRLFRACRNLRPPNTESCRSDNSRPWVWGDGHSISWSGEGSSCVPLPRSTPRRAAPDTWERRLMVGLLTLGPTARISHESAAQVHGLDRSLEGRVEFTVDRSHRNATAPGHVHSTSRTRPLDVVTIHSFRVTSATRTIVDLARARISPHRLAASIDSAVRLGLTSPLVLHADSGSSAGPVGGDAGSSMICSSTPVATPCSTASSCG